MELTKFNAAEILRKSIEETIQIKGVILDADELLFIRHPSRIRWQKEGRQSYLLTEGIGPQIKLFIVGLLEQRERD